MNIRSVFFPKECTCDHEPVHGKPANDHGGDGCAVVGCPCMASWLFLTRDENGELVGWPRKCAMCGGPLVDTEEGPDICINPDCEMDK